MLFLGFFGGAACYQSAGIVQNAEQKPLGIHRLLALPFQDISKIYGENVNIRCQLCGKVFTTGSVKPEATQFLTERLNEMLNRSNSFKLIPASQARGVISSLLQQSRKEPPEIDLYIKTGQSLHADGVLACYVYQFRDREGTDYSVAVPASVTLHMDMIEMKAGQIVWSKSYHETQRSLSEDLFQL